MNCIFTTIGDPDAMPFPVITAPEPALWVLMIVSNGQIGTVLRRRRTGHASVLGITDCA